MDKLSLRELLRYGYTGVLCILVAVLIDGPIVAKLVSQLGPVLTPLAALALGTVVYLVFKALVGDLFLWRLVDWSHTKTESLLRQPVTRCKIRYLESQYQVGNGQGLAAYALVRDTLMPDGKRESFHVQHSEGYLLYVTAFVCGPVSFLGCAGVLAVPAGIRAGLALTAVVALAAGWRHDLVLCRAESAVLSALSDDEVRAVLIGGGFIYKRSGAD